MDTLEFRQIIEIDNNNLDIMTNWMYKWWGQEEGYTFDGVKCFLQHSFQKDRLPKTYGVFHNDRIIGMYLQKTLVCMKSLVGNIFQN